MPGGTRPIRSSTIRPRSRDAHRSRPAGRSARVDAPVQSGYDVIRGADEIVTGLWTIGTGDANTRSFTQAALDRGTGNQAETDRIIMRTDLAMGVLSLGGALRSAAQGGKLAAAEAKAAVQVRNGQVTASLANGSKDLIEEASGKALRAIKPAVDPVSRARFSGEPFAFGTGPRDVRVTALLDEASRASAITLSDLVDEVRYVQGSSYFDVENGKRVLAIGSDAFGKTMAGQLIEGAHEIGHAQLFDKLVRVKGFAAAEQEYYSGG